MEEELQDNHKYVFVCGMPRSGTSLLGRNIGRLADCTDLKNTGTIEDEGQYVQDVYTGAYEFGGAGRFGFNPEAHRTESSPLLTKKNVARLKACWSRYWDENKSIRVEKTPGNLLMTRFLQAAFPNSYFVVIRRHPVPVAMASQKWKVNVTSLDTLFRHWIHCQNLFENDRKYVRRVYELRYEDYVENADKYHQEIADFIGTSVPSPPEEDTFRYVTQWRNPTGLRVPERGMEKTSGSYNEKYLARWRQLLRTSPCRSYYRFLVRKYEPEFARFNYSLSEGVSLPQGGAVSSVVGRLSCLAADASALLWRLATRSREQLRVGSKSVLPKSVVEKISQARKA